MNEFRYLIKKAGTVTILYLLFILVFLSWNSVKFVKNEHTINDSTGEKIEYYYGTSDYVPINMLHKNDDSKLTFEKTLIIMVVSIIYIYFLLQKKEGGVIPLAKIREMFIEELSKRQDIETDAIVLLETSFSVMTQIDNNTRIHDTWIVFADIKYDEKRGMFADYETIGYEYDAHTGEKRNQYIMTAIPEGNHWKCDICGKFPNTKTITPTELVKTLADMGMKMTGK